MKIFAADLFTKASPMSRAGKIFQFPLTRILIAICFMIPVFLLSKGFDKTGLLQTLSGNSLALARYIQVIVFFALFLLAFILYTKYIEKRKALEIFGRKWALETGSGFLVSFVLVGIVVVVLVFTGCFIVTGVIGNKRLVFDLFVKFLMGAFIEELLFRLIIYKLTEELLGTWIALLIQVLLFGFAHGLNDNATLFTSFSVAVSGGLILSAAYIYSRTLWLPLGFHWGWNFAQSGIFGMPNSGTAYKGLLIPDITGPEWLTGGKWGIEGSYLAILVCLATGIILIILAKKNAQIIRPAWKREE
jgi:uncharacterized protein